MSNQWNQPPYDGRDTGQPNGQPSGQHYGQQHGQPYGQQPQYGQQQPPHVQQPQQPYPPQYGQPGQPYGQPGQPGQPGMSPYASMAQNDTSVGGVASGVYVFASCILPLLVLGAVILAFVIGFGVLWAPVTAVLGTLSSEIFSTRVRYTGITLGYQLGAALAGGTAPLIATWLLAEYKGSWQPVALYMLATVAISLVAILAVGKRRTDDEVQGGARAS